MSEPVPTLNPADSDMTREAGADTSGNPVYAEAKAAAAAPRGGANLYGCCSIEKFCDAGSLAYTHEDAQGFYDYVKQFNAPNFWYKDAGVAVWLYYEPYDHWQDTYGADAVRSFYHSGHGGM
ncbi:MAG: hypothetical protein QOH86_531, partial [Sphingomonadales bacterium]|nr:hypothetical protein [Sphingomonadales bacterium]